MTTNVATAPPQATVAEVAKLLADRGVSAVPVCNADGTLLGMISEGDLLKPFTTTNQLRTDWWLGLLAEGESLACNFLEYIRLDKRQARALMAAPAVSVSPATSGAEIADILIRHHFKRVPVVQSGKLVGIVSRADLIRTLANSPQALAETG